MSTEKPKFTVLIVDDDPGVIDFLSLGLRYEGYSVDSAANGSLAYERARAAPPDVVILDWMLPDASGPEMCQRLRTLADPAILMLTAKDEVADRVAGLRAGADDYLVKPFHFDELLARLEALLRRRGQSYGKDMLQFSDLYLWPSRREARRGQERLALTPTEFDLLHLLMRHPYQVLPKETILQNVWGYDFGGDASVVEVYIGYLRRKLGEPPLINTVRGVGYVLEEIKP
ncbi:MAG: Response regulator MprA [Pelotomaculum sp. PtaU1.Bin035]|nr:MAG: Response regulator MprA [Pelotomaculum sp. PtaU1.Bin035]